MASPFMPPLPSAAPSSPATAGVPPAPGVPSPPGAGQAMNPADLQRAAMLAMLDPSGGMPPELTMPKPFAPPQGDTVGGVGRRGE